MRTAAELSMACICDPQAEIPSGSMDVTAFRWPEWMDAKDPWPLPESHQEQLDAKAVAKRMLRSHELVGLFIPGRCACTLDNLMPCGECRPECRSGYRLSCRHDRRLYCMTGVRGQLPHYCPCLREAKERVNA